MKGAATNEFSGDGMATLAEHPIAAIFPMMEGEAFNEFLADIRANGVVNPITLHEGMILDGRNRYKAAVALSIDAPTQDFTGADPLQFVISANLHRRQLTIQQRAAVAAKMANLKHGGNRRQSIKLQNCNLTDKPLITLTAAAKAVGVSKKTVCMAKKMMREDPETFSLMERGVHIKGLCDKPDERRHPLLKKTHHFKHNEMVEKMVTMLQGICKATENIDVNELDKSLTPQWSDEIKNAITVINKFRKDLLNENQ